MTDPTTDLDRLVAAYGEAKTAFEGAEERLLAELSEAKAAYRDDQSEGNKARKAAAAERVQAYRRMARADRADVVVGGDAVEGEV